MKLRTLLVVVSAALFASSCCGAKKIETKIVVKDSIITKVEERLVEVHDTVTFTIPVERLVNVAAQNSHLATRYAVSDAYIDSMGLLYHTLENISQNISIPNTVYVPVHDTIRYEGHSSEDIETKYVEVEKPLHWWQTALIWIGSVSLALLVLFVVYSILKKKKE